MGKKYSLNSEGRVLAEKDFYTPAGPILKGFLGGKIANENQLSQDGNCWLLSGDMSMAPNVVLRDNAFLYDYGNQAFATSVHATISGDTTILASLNIYNITSAGNYPLHIKDSFIAPVLKSLTVGASSGHEVEQGSLNYNAAAGTPIGNMKLENASACRSKARALFGKNSRVVNVPNDVTVRVLYFYAIPGAPEVYSGIYRTVIRGTLDLYSPEYIKAYLVFNYTGALTPASLEAKGIILENGVTARDLFISNTAFYKDSFISNSNIFFQETASYQVLKMILAGSIVNCPEVISPESSILNRVVQGHFNNIGKLILDPIDQASTPVVANNDLTIRASDCPLLRIDTNTIQNIPLTEDQGLVVKNCIVPKAQFRNNVIEGNKYEGIDFSYAQDELGNTSSSGDLFRSSHYQGMYDLFSNTFAPIARVSGTHNFDNATTLFRPFQKTRLPLPATYDYTQIPHIEGSAYAGVLARLYGDIKLVGQKYTCKVFNEVSMEEGTLASIVGRHYEDILIPSDAERYSRLRSELVPVSAGDTFTIGSPYAMLPSYFDEEGRLVSLGYGSYATQITVPNDSRFKNACITIRKDVNQYIGNNDIASIGLKLTKAFEKKYYVTNTADIPVLPDGSLDPAYTLLDTSYWENGYFDSGASSYGKKYEELKRSSANYVILKVPLNVSVQRRVVSVKPGFLVDPVNLDSLTKVENPAEIPAFLAVRVYKSPLAAITPSEMAAAGLVIEYTPSPRIIPTYQSTPLSYHGDIRMTDNAVLCGNITNDNGKVIKLRGDSVADLGLTCGCVEGWNDAHLI